MSQYQPTIPNPAFRPRAYSTRGQKGADQVDLRIQLERLRDDKKELTRSLKTLGALTPPLSSLSKKQRADTKELSVEVLAHCLRTLGSSNTSYVRKKIKNRPERLKKAITYALETLDVMKKLSNFGSLNPIQNVYGCLNFKGNTSIAPYIKLNGRIFCGQDNSFMDACIQFIVQRLGIKPPRMVVSAFGTEDNSDSIINNASFRSLLRNGLEETPDIWVITDGRNGGISKLIASIMMEIRGSNSDNDDSMYTVPVIAIAPWSKEIFVNKSQNEDSKFEAGVYRDYDSKFEEDLDKNHRLFLFIDFDDDDKHSDDIAFRRLFIARMREVRFFHFKEWRTTHLKLVNDEEQDSNSIAAKGYMDDENHHDHFLEGTTKIGTLELVVGGRSERALRLAQTAMNERTLSPLVIIQGSGGLADMLSYAYRYLHDPNPENSNLNKDDFDSLIRQEERLYDRETVKAYNAKIMNIVAVDHKIVNFDFTKSDGNDLDSGFLKALLNNMTARMRDPALPACEIEEENASELQAKYSLHLNMLRYAIGFDRVNEADAQMDEVEHLYNRMNAEAVKHHGDHLSPTMAASRSHTTQNKMIHEVHRKLFHFETEAYLTIDVHYGMALEWALIENKIGLVKSLIHKVANLAEGGGMVEFLYGEKPMIRKNEGYGTTLAELYEYESMEDSSSAYYLEPILRLINNENERFRQAGVTKDTPQQIKNNVRVRSVWSLITQILTDDSTATASTHGTFSYETLPKVKLLDHNGVRNIPDSMRNVPDSMNQIGGRIKSAFHVNFTEEEITQALKEDRTLESTYFHLVKQSDEDKDLCVYQELMIWAVVMNRKELALYFWQMGGHAIANALIASMIYDGIANHEALTSKGKMADVCERMEANSEEFEKHAIAIMSVCYSQDPALAQDILEHGLSEYAWLGHRYDCLQLAESANNLEFVSHPACQAVIERKWSGKKSPSLIAYLKNQDRVEKFGEKVYRKAASPLNKFRMDVVSYFFFLILLMYVSLETVDPAFFMSFGEWVLLVWITMLVFEEMRQTMVIDNGYTLYNMYLALKDYWSQIWNKLDLAIFAVYYTAFALRYTYQEASIMRDIKGLYGVTCILATIRFSHFFNVLPGLGPKFLILGRLLPSLLHYLVILLVFIIPYGVFLQAIMNPFTPLQGESAYSDIMRVLYIPYFQMYGELMLEDIHAHTSCSGEFFPFDHCESIMQRLIPAFLAIYMIITSVMIMNMLIADFTMTFENIFEQQNAVWKMQLFKLVLEYETKTLVPAPFNFPVVLFTMIKNLCVMLACGCCGKARLKGDHMAQLAELEHSKIVEIFQDQLADAYFDKHEEKAVQNPNSNLENLMNKALSEIEYFKARHYNSEKRKECDEEEDLCEDCHDGIRHISHTQPIAIEYFVKKYQDTSTYYAPVDANSLSFAANNNPRPFNYAYFCECWAKRYQFGMPPSEVEATERWNNVIHTWGTKGVLQKLHRGENRVVYHIVTRWKRDIKGIRMMRSGKPLLEFVAVKRTNHAAHWACPEMHHRLHTNQHNKIAKTNQMKSPTYMAAFHDDNYKYNIQPKERVRIHADVIDFLTPDHASVIYEGFIDDARNTGAAWYHTKVQNFHDDGTLLDAFDVKIVGNIHDIQMAEVAWLTLHANVQMSGEQLLLLKRVASNRNAYW